MVGAVVNAMCVQSINLNRYKPHLNAANFLQVASIGNFFSFFILVYAHKQKTMLFTTKKLKITQFAAIIPDPNRTHTLW